MFSSGQVYKDATEEDFLVLNYDAGEETSPGGGGDAHMKQTGMLVGNFEFNP